MKRTFVFLAVALVVLAGCGDTTPKGPGDLGTFKVGEPVTFRLDDTVYVCTDQLPYAIVHVTDGGQRRVALQHSCMGIVGSGIDQFCENGQATSVEVIYCTDAIFCEDQEIRESITWDQQEYVELSENCAGQTIRREVKQQVPAGKYQVVVQEWKTDHVENRIVGEFTISE